MKLFSIAPVKAVGCRHVYWSKIKYGKVGSIDFFNCPASNGTTKLDTNEKGNLLSCLSRVPPGDKITIDLQIVTMCGGYLGGDSVTFGDF